MPSPKNFVRHYENVEGVLREKSMNEVNVSFQCPHCNLICGFSDEGRFANQKYNETIIMFKCNSCSKYVYVVFNSDFSLNPTNPLGNRIDEPKDYYPKLIPSVPSSVPENVAKDFEEALKCFDIGAYKASAVMCRRALQSSVIEKGATRNRLVEQIDELFERRIITEEIKNLSHKVRSISNTGAHPNDDGLSSITSEEVESLIHFMNVYFLYVYTLQDELRRSEGE